MTRRRVSVSLVVSVLLSAAAVGSATTYDWDRGGGTYNWHTGANWDPSGVPGYGEPARIDQWCSAANPVVVNSTANAGSIRLGDDVGDAGYLRLNAGTLYVDGNVWVGNDGTGGFAQAGGTCRITVSSADLLVGYGNDNAVGTCTVSGGDLYAYKVVVGDDGVGRFVQSGGSVHVGAAGSRRDLIVGYATTYHAGTGTYRLAGGNLYIDDDGGDIIVGDESTGYVGTGRFEWFRPGGGGITIAAGGSGKMHVGTAGTLAMGYDFNADTLMSGGYVPLSGLNYATLEITNGATATKSVGTTTCQVKYLYVGTSTGAGTASQSAGTVKVSQSARIGHGGTGLYHQTGGVSEITTHLYLGTGSAGAAGTYRLDGGELHVGLNVYEGPGSSAIVIDGGTLVLGGTQLNVDELTLGAGYGKSGAYTLPAGKTLNVSVETIGGYGTGSLTQTGGANNPATCYLAYSGSGVGTYNLSGTAACQPQQLYVGYYGRGVFDQSGGTVAVGGDVRVGDKPSSQGLYTLAGGSLSANRLYVGASGTGTVNQTAGQANLSQYVYFASNGTGRGTYRLAGGTLSAVSCITMGDGIGTLIIDGGAVSTPIMVLTNLVVGDLGVGAHSQSGGSIKVGGEMVLGRGLGSSGTYAISGGSLTAGGLYVGGQGAGHLNLAGAGANVTVTQVLQFGPAGSLSAAAGSTVSLPGTNVLNFSSEPGSLLDLLNLTLVFEPSLIGQPDKFEVACKDRGVSLSGFDENFALGALMLGRPGVSGGACVTLIDDYENRGPGEALYLHDLYVYPGSTLDMTGINVYYDGTLVEEGQIIGGTPQFVPEPAALAALCLGSLAVALRRRRA